MKSPLEETVDELVKTALKLNPHWHPPLDVRTCVPMKVPGLGIYMCPFSDCGMRYAAARRENQR